MITSQSIKRDDAQIFVLCHKDVDYNIPNNSLYTPILCGADINYIKSDYLKDNVGDDNISSFNPFYLECTGTYWIWKNKVSQYKYIGQCQYRRQLIFKEDFNFDAAFMNHDFIVATPYYFVNSVYNHYRMCHNIKDLEMAGCIIRDIFPDYYDAWNYITGHNMLYYSAGFIFRSEMYDKYCRFLFGVLQEYRELLNFTTIESVRNYVSDNIKNGKYGSISDKSVDYQSRLGGYLAERLFTCFVHKNMKSPMLVNYTKMEKC
jgi:hypothetical protein